MNGGGSGFVEAVGGAAAAGARPLATLQALAEALGAMGAVAELVTVIVSGSAPARTAALSTLENVAKQGLAGISAEIVPEACAVLEAMGEAKAAARLTKLVAGV